MFSRKNSQYVEPLHLDDYDLRLCPSLQSRMVVCKAKTGVHRFLSVAIYGYHSEGLSEHNIALLHAVTLLNHVVGLPMVLGGDSNLTRGEITESGLLCNCHLNFLSSDGVTCLEGGGRCIDNFLASAKICCYAHESRISTVCFYPHLVSTVTIPIRFERCTTMKQRVPRV